MADNLVIPELFGDAVRSFPDKVALQIMRDNQWLKVTYKDLEGRALKVAAFLIKEGFRKSDTAAVILENRPEWAIMYLGIMYAGMACVPLDIQLSQQEIKNLITDSAAKIVFSSYDIFAKKVRGAAEESSVKIVLLDMPQAGEKGLINFSDIDKAATERNIRQDTLPQDIASLIYTSGTTGDPKGVLLSHANICSNFKGISKLNFGSSPDNVLSILPLHHTYAFTVTLITPLFLGATVTYCQSLKPEDLIRVIRDGGVTIMAGVPQLFSMLHKTITERTREIPSLFLPFALPLVRIKMRRRWGKRLRLLVSGGARLDPKIAGDLSALSGLKVIEGYGLTETSPVVALNPLQKVKFGSVGKPIPGVEIKILNPDKAGVGQVLIKGPNVMQGYFKHPDWTGEAIKEGWFYSGDMGYIDSDGYLFLVGREKEVIVLSSGKNIYPEELEEYYGKSPYIKEICIVAAQEEKFGRMIDSLQAIVAPNLEYFKQRNETDIRGKIRWELENLANTLPSYKHIMGFILTKEEFPRTALRKIKRYLMKEKYLSGIALKPGIKEPAFSQEEAAIMKKDIAGKVIGYISGQLHKPVYLESHLEIDLGIDSLSRIELGLGLEKILQMKLPDGFFYSVSTVKELIAGILSLSEKPSVGHEAERQQGNWKEILSTSGNQEAVNKIITTPSFLSTLIAWVFKGITLSILSVFWNLRVKGRANLPLKGPYLICPNHASYLDPFVVFSGIPFHSIQRTFFLGYSDIVELPLIRWARGITRIIPIDPTANFTGAMQAVSHALSQGKIVCIFPEGRRSVDGNIGEFKKGVGILIKELNIPVVPVYIKGSHQSWPRTSRLPRLVPLEVIFGCPLSCKELLEKKFPGQDDYQAIANNLREEVLKLA